MARPKSTTSTAAVNSVKKNETATVEIEKTETEPVVKGNLTTEKNEETPVKTDENKVEKAPEGKKEYHFADDEKVKIVCKERAGKRITCNTLDVIEFDDKGNAEVKGINANYLLNSGLGFYLAK